MSNAKHPTDHKDLIDLAQWEFEFQQRDKHTILMSDIWARAIKENFQQEVRLDVEPFDCLFTSFSKGYVKRAQKKRVVELLRDAVSEKAYVDYLLKSTLARVRELEKFSDDVVKLPEKLSRKEILRLWKELDNIMLVVVPWFYIPWYVTEFNLLTDKVKAGLLRHTKEVESVTDLQNALLLLILPTKEAVFHREQKDFYQLCKVATGNFQHSKTFLRKAEDYLRKYAWMKTFMSLPIEPLTMDELINRVKEGRKGGFVVQYEIQEEQKKKNEKVASRLLHLLSHDKHLVGVIRQSKALGWVLTYSVELAIKAASKLIPFYKILAKELGVPYSQWNNLTSAEIGDVLEGKLEMTKQELKQRDQGYVFLMENGKVTMVVGKEGKSLAGWIDSTVGAVGLDVQEIAGQPASPGIVKGKVRKALTPQESYALEPGEILMCSMTSPDYIPAMKRAAAIVTDEGGLLSHAAIVSRELGKPCVVGTKIATKILKDGDAVEVDANQGVIKIIRKDG